VQDGEPAHARVEDADRSRVHRAIVETLRAGYPEAALRRILLIALVSLVLAPQASAFTREDVTLQMSDGVPIAASLYLPDGDFPVAGWPGVMALHGLNGDRRQTAALAETVLAPQGYAVLTFDARGHGASKGQVTIDGPREIADVRELFEWFAALDAVRDDRIGGWGISYGGGAVLRAAAEGVPFAALETVESWTDLYSALMPQDLAKSGVVAGFVSGIRPDALSPLVEKLRDDAYAGRNFAEIRAFARERSTRHLLGGLRTPTYLFQGRRDFVFGLDQAKAGFRALAGPKRLYIGAFGHSPSSFPGPDVNRVFSESLTWYDRWLKSLPNGVGAAPRVTVAPELGRGRSLVSAQLPRTFSSVTTLKGTRTIATTGRVVRTAGRTQQTVEVFGSPVVQVTARSTGGWSRLVATLTATPPRGKEIVVSAGGVRTRPGTRSYSIRLIDQATLVPARSSLRLVLAGDTTKQSAGNLLYLDLPMNPGARVTIGRATLRLPVLGRPISR
jgi:ABC-2 type transport system ATP-binding protein